MAASQSEEFGYFVTYASIVTLKMVLMSALTAYYRITKKIFSNPEDLKVHRIKDKNPIFDDPDVERVRRCHRNDLENIVPFLALGLLYAFASGASLTTIVWHYRVFVISRLLHTVFYVSAMQPARGFCFLVGAIVNVSMGVQLLMNN